MLRRSRHGGVRLGRKLLGLWRWALCGRRRRPRGGGYRRLPQQPCAGDGNGSTPEERKPKELAPVLRWGRTLARRLSLLGWRAGGHRMLDDGGKGGSGKGGGEPAAAVSTPKGQVAVYVVGGGEAASQSWCRYVVPVVYFNHPMFGELLREAEEEFGFQHPGVITIPCPAARFEQAAALAAAAKKGFGRW